MGNWDEEGGMEKDRGCENGTLKIVLAHVSLYLTEGLVASWTDKGLGRACRGPL